MGEPKPSGIRPPSKIGRPCCTVPPRPAIPTSPSKSTGNTMEHLWETHGRKLNEAGTRRGSDTSVVLTEDTDSFIIGDRVWVGGTKPGAIAYIGETQFAPGDWAGVVLDEPIGKNDGSVAGCRYFQCESKRGIFSRLTRLTRQPLSEIAATSPTQKTPTTPPDNMKGNLIKSVSPSLNTSTTSLSSTVSQRELKIGDRVIVSSSQGSKTGVLRYMGTTEFAPGEWCGVELDDPVGKNDGSVGDKRYFECRPKYGLFAPAHKVSRSPTSKRTSCVVHKPSGAALNSTLKKTNSRESLVSLSSSINSTATSTRGGTGTTRWPRMRTSTPARSSMQEMLKERQQEIEFLRRERDLERDRVTKAANQADQAEQAVTLIKEEYDKYREEMEKTVLNVETALKKLLEEKSVLVIQLEEEKRKCEDLLFRFEEESVNRDDIQKERTTQSVINSINEKKISELEKQLSEERERVIQLERDSTKLFEAEEELTRLRSELCSTTSQDKNDVEDLRSHNQALRESKIALEKEVYEQSLLVKEHVKCIEELKSKLNEKEKEYALQKQLELDLKDQLEKIKQNLLEQSTHVENIKKEYEENTNNLKAELCELKNTIENIKKEHINEKEAMIAEYMKIIEEKSKLLEVKTQELDAESKKYIENQSTALENLKAENSRRIHELTESFNQQLSLKDSKLEEISKEFNEKVSEAKKLTDELSSQQDLYQKRNEELNNTLQKLEETNAKFKAAEDRNAELFRQLQNHENTAEDTVKLIQEKQKLEEDLSALKITATNQAACLDKLNDELKAKDKEHVELRNTTTKEIEELTKNFHHQLEEKSKYIEEISSDISQKSLLLNKLEADVVELRTVIASKDEEIKHLLEKSSELQYALTLSEQTKTNLESELRVFESNVENLNQQLRRAEEKFSNVSAQKEKLESDIANFISTSADSSEQLQKYNEELRNKEKEIDALNEKAYEAEKNLATVQERLKTAEEELIKSTSMIQQVSAEIEELKSLLDKEKTLNTELSKKIHAHETKERELLEKVEKAHDIEKTLKEKCDTIADLTEKLKKAEGKALDLQLKQDDTQKSHETENLILQKEINAMKTELITSQEEVKSLQKAKAKLEADQSANRWTIEELNEKLSAENEIRLELESFILEKDSKISDIESKLLELQEENKVLSMSKENINQDLAKILNTTENTIKDLESKLANATKTIELKNNEVVKAQTELEQYKVQISEFQSMINSMKQSQSETNNKLQSLQDALSGRENEISKAEETKSKLESMIEELQTELINVKAEISTKDNLLAEMDEMVKNVQDSKEESLVKLQDSLQREIKAIQLELDINMKRNIELEKEQKSLLDLTSKQTTDLNMKDQLIQDLKKQVQILQDTEMKQIKSEQESKREEMTVMQNELSEMRKQNENLLLAKESLEKLIKDQETKMEVLTNTMKNKEKEAEKNTQNLIEKLNVLTTELSQSKEARSRLEKENKQINLKLSEALTRLNLSVENAKNNHDAAGGDAKQQMGDKDIDVIRLKEENESIKSQIDFLNSVIIDMQRKNEALLCKIEVLEMGVPANEADDYSRSTLEKKKDAPRMYCDICDQFDLHETEDCPRQAQDFVESEKIIKSPKKKSVERPYCETCEVFGHDTRDCDDGETY